MPGRRYLSNGGAAVDMDSVLWSEEDEQNRLPEEAPLPERPVRVKAKTSVSPLSVLLLTAAGFMLILVIFSYVQLYEATSEAGVLSARLAAIEQENQALRSQYEGRIDLEAIEERAIHELGMSQPTTSQNVYLNLAGEDRAVLVRDEKPGFFTTLVEACASGVKNLLAYLSGKPE